jgi:phosphoribosyl 1,2-cyclic phosphodiesterase
MHMHILASGSKGNACVVEGPEGYVLVDDGLSRKKLLERAGELGLDMERVVCLVLTHEHADHVSGVSVWCRRWDGRVVASPGTMAGRDYLARMDFERVEPGGAFEAAGMTVETFPTSHDVNQPMGMVFRAGGDAVGICTDTGTVTPEARRKLRNVRILALESNHDPKMLANGPYPAFLKARVGSDRGHLSNAQAAAVLPELIGPRTETVVAMHISEKNNRPQLAVAALAEAAGARRTDAVGMEAETPDGRLKIRAAAQERPMTIL